MIVPFTVDPAIFDEFNSVQSRINHESLLDTWSKVGQLIIPSTSENESVLAQKIKMKPTNKYMQEIQIKWKQCLKVYRKKMGVPNFEKILNSAEYIESKDIFPTLKLVSLDSTRAELWGLGEFDISIESSSKYEICRFGHEYKTNNFSNALQLTNKPVEPGTKRQKVWDERILGLAKDSPVIVINDAYALDHFLDPKESNKSNTGLGWFLRRLANIQSPGQINVEIITCPDVNIRNNFVDSKEAYRERISNYDRVLTPLKEYSSSLVGGKIREITVYLTPYLTYKKVDHYRSIRFHDFQVIDINIGMELFENDFVSKTHTFYLHPWYSENATILKRDEQKIRDLVTFKSKIDCCK
jgi:hypothetical protein